MQIRIGKFLAALCLSALAATAVAWDRGTVATFATLPPGAAHPEGITVDAQGRVYVATFGVNAPGSSGRIFVFNPQGQLLYQGALASSPLLLDIAFHPLTGELLVVDFGAKKVLSAAPFTGTTSEFATIPGGEAAGPNVLAFDDAGNVYISDSFQGKIWRTGPRGGAVTEWASSPLLTTTGVPPFGANGMAFNRDRTAMFVANTGNDTVVRIPVLPGGVAGTPQVFVHSINGADGLIIDEQDNLWVAANQADEIVVVNPAGRVIAKLGDFGGIDAGGAPRGLLFPAGLVRRGEYLYVTNLALDLRLFGLPPAVDSPWTAEVRQHTVSRLRARLPSVPGLRGAAAD